MRLAIVAVLVETHRETVLRIGRRKPRGAPVAVRQHRGI